ncbi:MAG: glycosyltransferase [Cyanobacteria bacterium J06607_15]
MTSTRSTNSVIIITGMHRSGTSLTASLLQSAGVYLGDRLMSADSGNAKGYFEDWDFVELHQQILTSQSLNSAGWTTQSEIEILSQYQAAAQELLATRQQQKIWGWKDPRTTLFLDFWLEQIPYAKYVFVYRSPWEVLDSLFRRGDAIFAQDPDFALTQWCHYNQAILDFSQRHPEQCLLFEIDQIVADTQSMVNLINRKWDMQLQPPEALYEKPLLKTENNSGHPALVSQFFPQAINLYQQLQQQAKDISGLFPKPASTFSEEPANILRDWSTLRKTENAKSQVESELSQTAAKLSQTESELSQTIAKLSQTEAKLSQTESELSQVKKRLEQERNEKARLSELVQAMESSKFWQIRLAWINFKQKLGIGDPDLTYQNHLAAPQQSPRSNSNQGFFLIAWLKRHLPYKSLLKKTIKTVSLKLCCFFAQGKKGIPQSRDIQYQRWLQQNYPAPKVFEQIKLEVSRLKYQPLISVIVPVYNPEKSLLRAAIESVTAQLYGNWELCLVDDRSTKSYVKAVLEEYAAKDRRIKTAYRQENGHISRASNTALEIATGEYVALLDHDDLLAPHALSEVVKLLNQHPEADFIYSDEDKVDCQNLHQSPFFKPDWCPDSFLARMYTCHLGVYRRSLVRSVGNFRVGFEGSQDYDLVLRVTEKTDRIFHIPQVLYHWRMHEQSAAAVADAKPYAAIAAQKAIAEAIARRGEPGEVIGAAQAPGVYTVRYKIKEHKLVSIIIPTKDLADTLNVCLESIFSKTTYPNYEVIVIDNGSTETKTADCLAAWQQRQPERFRSYAYNIPFNYSQINNYAVEQAQGDYLLFLNNDTEVVSEGWLGAMVEQAQRQSIGAVGGLLLYPDNTVQHAGVVLGIGGVAGHSHRNFAASMTGYFSQLVSTNNYSAVTAACLMCRRQVFEEVGGFETDLAIAFNDVDFCLKIASHGYRNIYLPHVVLYHYESKTRGYEDTVEKQARFAREIQYMRQKWSAICDRDPHYNPHLSLKHEDFSLHI